MKRDFSKELHHFLKKTILFLLKITDFAKITGVLQTVSIIYESIIQKQIIDYIKRLLLLYYVDTEKASLHKYHCFISLKNGTL